MKHIIIIICLILLNGFFAMAEIAIISARRSRLEKDSKEGSKSAATALKLASDPDIFLSTIQIGITLIGILTGIYSGDALSHDLGVIISKLGVSLPTAVAISQVAIIVIVTYLTLVLGELVPKRVGLSAADSIARIMARPIYWLSIVTKPFVWLLAKSTSIVVAIMGVKKQENVVTEAEIKSIIQEGASGGEVQKVEQDIMERVFLMGDLKVSSIMTHRSDLCWVDITATAREVQALLTSNLHDNYPVAQGSLDNVKGLISLKDIILNIDKPDFSVEKIMRPAQAFHENMSIYNGLERLKEDGQVGCALVFDEFGGCQGIITLRDILEGLIGMVNTEHNDPQIVERADGQGWLVDGQCTFYDFLVYFEIEDETTDVDYNTVSGLILSRLNHIPSTGESVTWRNFTLEVIDMDQARIDKILITSSK